MDYNIMFKELSKKKKKLRVVQYQFYKVTYNKIYIKNNVKHSQ